MPVSLHHTGGRRIHARNEDPANIASSFYAPEGLWIRRIRSRLLDARYEISPGSGIVARFYSTYYPC